MLEVYTEATRLLARNQSFRVVNQGKSFILVYTGL